MEFSDVNPVLLSPESMKPNDSEEKEFYGTVSKHDQEFFLENPKIARVDPIDV